MKQRENKFHAWDKINKKWIDLSKYPLVLFSDGSGYILLERDCHNGDKTIDLKDVIIVQFTGLTDKQGKEIYEGDIVKHKSEGIWEIKWGFVGCDYHGGVGFSIADPDELSPSYLEVIGNIYENKDLLKERK